MSDDLPGLIAQLEKEVAPLERALRLREAEERGRLAGEEQRLSAAKARAARAAATLKAEGAQLKQVELRRAELLQRVRGWRGQLWSIGHGTLAVSSVAGAMVAFPLVLSWLGTGWAVASAAAHAGLFVALYFLIPEKR